MAPLHPERGLALALARHLSAELPWMDFTLADGPGAAVVWVCGYEPGNAALIRRWRARHPRAVLLVTGKPPAEPWTGEVLAAGADHALAWPLDLQHLARLLRSGPLRQRA